MRKREESVLPQELRLREELLEQKAHTEVSPHFPLPAPKSHQKELNRRLVERLGHERAEHVWSPVRLPLLHWLRQPTQVSILLLQIP